MAEAAKVIENTQRDINIALMNELAMIFARMDVDTRDVLAAAATKWNFLPFTPGLVGGHCIGVDPYYLAHKAAMLSYQPEVILAGRRVNDAMGTWVAARAVKALVRRGLGAHDAVVTILGFTFKENVPDLRNSRVVDIVRELGDYGLTVQVHDPCADPAQAIREYGVEIVPVEALRQADAVILAVAHAAYVERGWSNVAALLRDGRGIVIDVKGVLDRASRPRGIELLRL